MPDFIALDAVLDVQTEGASLPPFWQFEEGGCNTEGLALRDNKPETVCPSAENAAPWDAQTTALITAYAQGFGGANHARLLVTIARAASNPITLNGGQNYYGFHFDVSSAGAVSCDGCATPAQITWSSTTLYGSFGGGTPSTLTGPGIRSNQVTVNGGLSGIAVTSMSPGRWVPDPAATAHVFGRNFEPGVVVKLTRSGSGDILGEQPQVASDGRSVIADFNLMNATPGLWDVVATNPGGDTGEWTQAFEVRSTAAAPDADAPAARETGITLLAPNPTSGGLRIGFALAKSGTVGLSVMDVQGREVATLAAGSYPAGRFETTWNGRIGDADAPMGIYFVRLRMAGVVMTRRLAIAR